MHRLILTSFLLLLCTAQAFAKGSQRLQPEDIYPRPGTLRIPKKISQAENAIFYYLYTFGTCAEGTCSQGPGVYFYFSGAKAVDGLFTVSLLMWKGTFSNKGADFEGSKYLIPLHYRWAGGKVGEELQPLDRYDFSDDKHIRHYLVASGRFARGASHYIENYDGHGLRYAFDTVYNPVMVTDDLAAYKAQPHAIDVQVWYADGKPRKVSAAYDAASPIKHFAGFCHPDYSPALGTADYAAGDHYTGFLLRDKPFGAGILTDKNGKIQKGYFYDGRLAQAADITLPDFVGKPAMPLSGGRAAQLQMGGAVSGTMWGDGGGLFISNTGDLFYTGKPGAGAGIDGWATTMQWEDVKVAYDAMPQVHESQYSGVFKNGLLAEGAEAAINFSRPLPPADYKLDTGWYSSTLTAIRHGHYAGGKLAGCGLVSYHYTHGTGSFEMEAAFKDGFAEPGSWVRINFTDGSDLLSTGLQLLDNRNYYCDALHDDTLSMGGYNAAKALPVSCGLGTEGEKAAYLAKMLNNITNADARRALLAKRAADEARRRAEARYITLSKVYYNKSHPEKCYAVGRSQGGDNTQLTLKPKVMRAGDAQVGDAVFYEGRLYSVGDRIDGYVGLAGGGGKKLNGSNDSIAIFENCTFIYDNTDWVCPVCHGERGTFGGKGYVYAITSYKETRSYAGPGMVKVDYTPQYTPVGEGKAQFYPCEACHGVGSRSTHNTVTVME